MHLSACRSILLHIKNFLGGNLFSIEYIHILLMVRCFLKTTKMYLPLHDEKHDGNGENDYVTCQSSVSNCSTCILTIAHTLFTTKSYNLKLTITFKHHVTIFMLQTVVEAFLSSSLFQMQKKARNSKTSTTCIIYKCMKRNKT